MNVRDKIYQVVREYKDLLPAIDDGEATTEQQVEVHKKLDELRFYTNQLLIINNDDLD